MGATVRTITVECATGDGSHLVISTEGQAEDSALQFEVKPNQAGVIPAVRVGIDELVELIGFQNLESARYTAAWGSDEDESEDED